MFNLIVFLTLIFPVELLPRESVVVHHLVYSLVYSEDHETALWIAYELRADRLTKRPRHVRTNDFRIDPAIVTGSATLDDYAGSGHDRGHLAPAGSMAWSRQAMSESFYMSNMSAQKPRFNRGVFKRLESQVRRWAAMAGILYVVTGPVLREGLPTIGDGVSIPEYYWKVLLDPDENKAIGFLLRNERSSKPLRSFAVSVDSVEIVTGLDFFPGIADSVEAMVDYNDW